MITAPITAISTLNPTNPPTITTTSQITNKEMKEWEQENKCVCECVSQSHNNKHTNQNQNQTQINRYIYIFIEWVRLSSMCW
jgi:hypothetical protein